MKFLPWLMMLVLPSPVEAQVFKCIAANGKTFYQDEPCPKATREKQLAIEKTDPAKINAAQKKLAQELKDLASTKDVQARRALKEREVEAIERNAKATEAMAKATWLQTETETSQNRYREDYFYAPWINWYLYRSGHPHHKPKHRPKQKPPKSDSPQAAPLSPIYKRKSRD